MQQTNQAFCEGHPSISNLSEKPSNPSFNISQYNALLLNNGLSHTNKYEYAPNSSPFKLKNNK